MLQVSVRLKFSRSTSLQQIHFIHLQTTVRRSRSAGSRSPIAPSTALPSANFFLPCMYVRMYVCMFVCMFSYIFSVALLLPRMSAGQEKQLRPRRTCWKTEPWFPGLIDAGSSSETGLFETFQNPHEPHDFPLTRPVHNIHIPGHDHDINRSPVVVRFPASESRSLPEKVHTCI